MEAEAERNGSSERHIIGMPYPLRFQHSDWKGWDPRRIRVDILAGVGYTPGHRGGVRWSSKIIPWTQRKPKHDGITMQGSGCYRIRTIMGGTAQDAEHVIQPSGCGGLRSGSGKHIVPD